MDKPTPEERPRKRVRFFIDPAMSDEQILNFIKGLSVETVTRSRTANLTIFRTRRMLAPRHSVVGSTELPSGNAHHIAAAA